MKNNQHIKAFEEIVNNTLEKQENNKPVHFKKGETLVKQGIIVNHVMFVKNGIVKLEYETENGTVLLDVIRGENMICLSGMFGNNIAKYSVVALTDTDVYDISRQVLENLVKSNGEFASMVVQKLNCNNHHLYQRVSSLNKKQMHGRVADVLLYLADDVYGKDAFPMQLSRQDLGNFSGMAMMSVIRTIQSMKNDGIITEENGEMIILDTKKLKQISENG
ncbi:MAG: Crp/Fnr family transcriptional regulator [Bacteroidales bacterium]